ncbi:MAG: hypothetical protein ACOYMP_04095 [Nodosilinea sp.]
MQAPIPLPGLFFPGQPGRGDLSIAYPLVRGCSILMVVAVTLALGQGHAIGPGALVGMGLVVLATPAEYLAFPGVWARQIKAAAIAGGGIVCAYGLALTALAFVSNVSYLTAFRQLSIPIGTVLGTFLLQEPCPPPRLLGTATILAGLILVSLG